PRPGGTGDRQRRGGCIGDKQPTVGEAHSRCAQSRSVGSGKHQVIHRVILKLRGKAALTSRGNATTSLPREIGTRLGASMRQARTPLSGDGGDYITHSRLYLTPQTGGLPACQFEGDRSVLVMLCHRFTKVPCSAST